MSEHFDEYEGWIQLAKAREASRRCANCGFCQVDIDHADPRVSYMRCTMVDSEGNGAVVDPRYAILYVTHNFNCNNWKPK